MIRQFEAKRFYTQTPEQAETRKQATLAEWKGRLRSGGSATNKNARDLSGRELRSDKPVQPHQLRCLVQPTGSEGTFGVEATSGDHRIHPVVQSPPRIPQPLILDPPIPPLDEFPVPTNPFTLNHPEIQHPKAVARFFEDPVTEELTLYQGLPAYYLPPQSPNERGLFRIHYHDKDFEDMSLKDLLRYQQAFKTLTKTRKDAKNWKQNNNCDKPTNHHHGKCADQPSKVNAQHCIILLQSVTVELGVFRHRAVGRIRLYPSH